MLGPVQTWGYRRVELIAFNQYKLDCRTTVDSNVGFNLVVPIALTWNQRQVRWDNYNIHYHNVCIEFGTSLARPLNQRRTRVV